jgi:AcrR family transcriptional regulator
MGRTAGATAAGTRERLLRAAADVFARRGYDGARVSDIAESAGLSNGALYAYFGSKAELLVGALRAHGRRLLDDVVAHPSRSISEQLLATGRSLRRRRDPDGYLIIEALAAARRDPDVARPMRDYVRQRADHLAQQVRDAQGRGEIDPAVSPEAVAHLCLALGLGTALLPPEIHEVDEEAWAGFLARLLTALEPDTLPLQTGAAS